MCGEELKFVQEAFRTNWIAPVGPDITAFEDALGEYCGGTHVTALSSGTSAIHLALKILGVEQGDLVLCQSFTFSGSANPIKYVGAEPVFIESEADTWNMSPEYLREGIVHSIKIGKKPKAIIYVHLYGMPAKVDEILSIAREFEIPVIEDAAEALGSSYKGKSVGTFGDISILSFNGNKIITTSGGGAFLSKNIEYVQKANYLATQARQPEIHYEHTDIGYNYRMSNVCAAIGRGQLLVIDQRVEEKRSVFNFYNDCFKNSLVTFQPENHHNHSNRWLTCILLESKELKEKIIYSLNKNNIESRPLWKPMHLQPIFRKCKYYGNDFSSDLFLRGLCLPSGSNLSHENLLKISTLILTAI